jgi:purine-binding chemotaxis protein CheW
VAAEEKRKNLQVVAFCLGEEEYAIDIQQLKEVVKHVTITPLPHAAEFIEGVINLRGDVIPVVDLRKRFGIGEHHVDAKTRIIIVEISENLLGMVVDEVTEVLHFNGEQIQDPPQGMLGSSSDFIEGIGQVEGRLIIILKPEKIISVDEKIELDEFAAETEELSA